MYIINNELSNIRIGKKNITNHNDYYNQLLYESYSEEKDVYVNYSKVGDSRIKGTRKKGNIIVPIFCGADKQLICFCMTLILPKLYQKDSKSIRFDIDLSEYAELKGYNKFQDKFQKSNFKKMVLNSLAKLLDCTFEIGNKARFKMLAGYEVKRNNIIAVEATGFFCDYLKKSRLKVLLPTAYFKIPAKREYALNLADVLLSRWHDCSAYQKKYHNNFKLDKLFELSRYHQDNRKKVSFKNRKLKPLIDDLHILQQSGFIEDWGFDEKLTDKDISSYNKKNINELKVYFKLFGEPYGHKKAVKKSNARDAKSPCLL